MATHTRSSEGVWRCACGAATVMLALAGCDVQSPLAPAEPIGEVPRWGESFNDAAQAKGSLVPGNTAPANNAGLPPGTVKPGETGDWSGGDPVLGAQLFGSLCVRCHGATGEGGALAGVGTVPALNDAGWQRKMQDKDIGRAIALGKGAMPSFMRDLDREKLKGLIAHIRTLRAAESGW